MYNLVVRNPFGGYEKGEMITDPGIVSAILNDSHKSERVVKVAIPPQVVTSPPEPPQSAAAVSGGVAYVTQAPPDHPLHSEGQS